MILHTFGDPIFAPIPRVHCQRSNEGRERGFDSEMRGRETGNCIVSSSTKGRERESEIDLHPRHCRHPLIQTSPSEGRRLPATCPDRGFLMISCMVQCYKNLITVKIIYMKRTRLRLLLTSGRMIPVSPS